MSKIVFNQYIVVNNHSERDELLEYYESKNIRWNSGDEATKINHKLPNEYPYGIIYGHNGGARLTFNKNMDRLNYDMIHKIDLSEFLGRKDSPYTFYKRDDALLLVHYKGSGISISKLGVALYSYVWEHKRVNEFTPLIGTVKIKTIGMKRNGNSILFNTHTNARFRPIILDSDGIREYENGYDGYIKVEHITI